MRVRILGSGASSGTPAIDWGWGGCDPANPRNRRTRPAILVEDSATRILVDTPPDLREQLINAGVSTVDAVLYTHAHADHLHGIDDLRAINRARNAALDAYADAKTLEVIGTRFGYVLEPLDAGATFYYKPTLVPHLVEDGSSFAVGTIPVTAFTQSHGFSTTLGFRFGPVGYTTDVVELPEHAFAILAGVRLWIIGAMVDRPHKTHCDVDKAIRWVQRIQPDRAVLTHLGNDLDYAALAARLPAGIEPAYDGMVLEA
ncbi:MAG: MBL fold metallo-hydrolase [Rhodospirillales bacterium]|nr:MAG: MBL fold metallo-hydrolase [Rhodospirillales bacterium]